jgi:hypothetical protein
VKSADEIRREQRGLPPLDLRPRGLRHWLARHMRFAADRLHPASAMHKLGAIPGYSFTFERCPHHGSRIVFREDGIGASLWYLGEERDRSWLEADEEWWPGGRYRPSDGVETDGVA